MRDLLCSERGGAWGPRAFAYGRQHPWAVFAAVLAGILVLDLMFATRRSSGDAGVWSADCPDRDAA